MKIKNKKAMLVVLQRGGNLSLPWPILKDKRLKKENDHSDKLLHLDRKKKLAKR